MEPRTQIDEEDVLIHNTRLKHKTGSILLKITENIKKRGQQTINNRPSQSNKYTYMYIEQKTLLSV